MNSEIPIPWHRSARLLCPAAADFNGSFLECLERWDKLSGAARSRSFIILSEAIEDKSFLQPSDLTQFVSHPDYLTQWKS